MRVVVYNLLPRCCGVTALLLWLALTRARAPPYAGLCCVNLGSNATSRLARLLCTQQHHNDDDEQCYNSCWRACCPCRLNVVSAAAACGAFKWAALIHVSLKRKQREQRQLPRCLPY